MSLPKVTKLKQGANPNYSAGSCHVFVMQFYELVYLIFAGYQVLATLLLLVTVLSAFVATSALYSKRSKLFQSVTQ